MKTKTSNGILLYFFENLLQFKEISHFISTRKGGFSPPPYDSLNLSFKGEDTADNIIKNRKTLAKALNVSINDFTFAEQVHKDNITIVGKAQKGKGALKDTEAIKETDAFITNEPYLYITILLADCVPILLFDPIKKIAGAIHAGWKSTSQEIASKTIHKMKKNFLSKPSDIIAGIGPSIGPCCFEVLNEVTKKFKNSYLTTTKKTKNDKTFLNLKEINRLMLLSSGLLEKNIEVSDICTFCSAHTFFSARHEKKLTGRFSTGIKINN